MNQDRSNLSDQAHPKSRIVSSVAVVHFATAAVGAAFPFLLLASPSEGVNGTVILVLLSMGMLFALLHIITGVAIKRRRTWGRWLPMTLAALSAAWTANQLLESSRLLYLSAGGVILAVLLLRRGAIRQAKTARTIAVSIGVTSGMVILWSLGLHNAWQCSLLVWFAFSAFTIGVLLQKKYASEFL